MDTITQAALGACIAQAGFSDKLGRKALVVGTVCGLLPDFDALLSIGSSDFEYLVTHRGWTHSFLVLPFIAFLVAWLSMKWAERKSTFSIEKNAIPENRYWLWYQLCFLALMTHPLLDLFTTYGTQILAPFSDARFTLDGIAIVDPIYTVPLLIAVFVGIFRKKSRNNKTWAIGALIFSSAYLSMGLVNSMEAKKEATQQLALTSFQAVDIRSSPTMFNTLLWRVVAKDADERYAVGFFSTVTKAPIHFEIYESTKSELVNRALGSEEGRILRWFSTDLLRATTKKSEDGNTQVRLTDMRFGMASNPIASFFSGAFEFDAEMNLHKIHTSNSNLEGITPEKELNSIWSMIWNEQ
jgi:inner membrane protein